MSTPLISRGQLVGVLTVYSTQVNAFDDDHCRILENVARHIAHTFQRALELSGPLRRDSLTGLPHVEQLHELIQSISECEPLNQKYALLFIDVVGLRQINLRHGRAFGDEVLRHVVRQAKAGLRVADLLFRNSGDDFVALIESADHERAEGIAAEIRNMIARNPIAESGTTSLNIEVRVTSVSSPRDGSSLRELFDAATQRRRSRRTPYDGPSIH